ncbi:hypothetical protein EW146_g3912 [Bondarzewia mesenterica]|uniref:Uncharacterized protein n=1 Tax=Bondarzewia mesenterica TaxID=1095465 RepID=A0A4S4LXF1_9AGAM|nr:hypothetical protein EW146_g3912 [Bondarzewia mesenterica]
MELSWALADLQSLNIRFWQCKKVQNGGGVPGYPVCDLPECMPHLKSLTFMEANVPMNRVKRLVSCARPDPSSPQTTLRELHIDSLVFSPEDIIINILTANEIVLYLTMLHIRLVKENLHCETLPELAPCFLANART